MRLVKVIPWEESDGMPSNDPAIRILKILRGELNGLSLGILGFEG